MVQTHAGPQGTDSLRPGVYNVYPLYGKIPTTGGKREKRKRSHTYIIAQNMYISLSSSTRFRRVDLRSGDF